MPELRDIEIEEISFVGRPSNNKRFIFYKSEEGGNEMENKEETKDGQVVKEETQEVDNQEIEKKLSEKVVNAVENAIKELKSVRRSLPEGIKEIIAVLEDFISGEEYSYGYPTPKSKGDHEVLKDMLAKSEERIRKLSEFADEVNRRLTALEVVKKSYEDIEVVEKQVNDCEWPSLTKLFG